MRAILDAIEQYAQTQPGGIASQPGGTQHSPDRQTGRPAARISRGPAPGTPQHGDVSIAHGEIMMPKEFEGIITGIFGYDTRPKHRAPAHMRAGGAGRVETMAYRRRSLPNGISSPLISRDEARRLRAVHRHHRTGGGFNNSDLPDLFSGDQGRIAEGGGGLGGSRRQPSD